MPAEREPSDSELFDVEASASRAAGQDAAGPASLPEGLSYEQARDELAAIVHQLEGGAATLEEALALWERGEALAAYCQRWLDQARTRIERSRAALEQPDAP